jgi:hypothetical protein
MKKLLISLITGFVVLTPIHASAQTQAGTAFGIPGFSGIVDFGLPAIEETGKEKQRCISHYNSKKRSALKDAAIKLRALEFDAAAESMGQARNGNGCEVAVVNYLSGLSEFYVGNYEAATPFLEAAIAQRDFTLDYSQRNVARKLLYAISTGDLG